ncbi:MAG: hypothetical protein ABIQ27_12315 [Flavobacterium sp.]|uniref:hypothetical protein n=1 Tax=Flavobacterium sp. TaxID=239 RepID=UPI003266EA2F
MRLNSRIHGAVDYGVVLFLFISPTFFALPDITSKFTYVLGVIHLLLTICTQFELGFFKIIPFKIHGIIELIVSLALFGLAFFLGNLEGDLAKYFYWSFSIAVFLTWLITDYKDNSKNLS